MSRILIIGYGPLPRPGMTYVTAASLRTRQIVKPILAAGHTVNLFTLPIPGTEGSDAASPAMVPDGYEGLGFQRFTSQNIDFAVKMLTEQARQLDPAAIVGTGLIPAYVAALLGTSIPIWADLPGSGMAEAQGLCWLEQDDARLAEAWSIERTILRRADKFSAVTRAQLHAVTGEMTALGRLNRFTFEYPFGHHLPNACFRWSDLKPALGANPANGPQLRGPITPSEAFIVLWSGGFNVSADAPMLVSVVNKLMERYPSVHFVVTGGRVERGASRMWEMFEELVAESPYKDRCHLLGWVSTEKLGAIHREADMAIHVDARNYETLFGGRARLNALAGSGVPIATTIGTELSEWLDDGHAVMAAPMGDADAMVEAIEPWIEQREGLKSYAHRATAIMDKDFSDSAAAKKLLEWVKNPKLAPDNRAKIEQNKGQPIDPATIALNAVEEQALLLSSFKLEDLSAAAQRVEAERGKKGFLFGFRRA